MAVSLDEDPESDIPFQPPPRTDGKVVTVRMPSFTVLDALFTVTSMLTLVADVGTDVNLVVRYFLGGYVVWGGLTLVLVAVSAVLVAVVSMKWHISDQASPVTKTHWIANIFLCGIFHRYILMFNAGLRARKSLDQDDFRELLRQQSDACILRVFESFLESAPQLVLQLYIMLSHHDYTVWTGISAMSSLLSLGWGVAAYTKAMRKTRPNKHKMSVSGLVLQTAWRVGTISARVAALALMATVLPAGLLIIMGVHFVAMFIWVVSQKTGFSKTRWEEYIFNFIMAVTYCFCFFNLREGQSRWRMLLFYTITVTENTVFTITYYFLTSHLLWLKTLAVALVFTAMFIGLACMLLYYRSFHPVGPIKPFTKACKSPDGVENGEGVGVDGSPSTSPQVSQLSRLSEIRRDFKYLYPIGVKPANSVLSAPGVSLESSPTTSGSGPLDDSSPDSPQDNSSTPPLPYHHPRHPGTMCSVQDLLANVSCTSNIIEEAGDEEQGQNPLPTPLTSPNLDRDATKDGHLSPSSFERSVSRELNIRLSATDVKYNKSELDTDQIRIEVQGGEASVVDHNERGPIKVPVLQTPHQYYDKPSDSKENDCERNVQPVEDSNIVNCAVIPQATNYSVDRQVPQVISRPNSIGLPLQSKYLSQTSLDDVCRDETQRRSTTILRTSIRGRSCTSETDVRLTSLPHLTTSTVNMTSNTTSRSQDLAHDGVDDLAPLAPQVPNVELAVIDRMHIIETESSGVSSEGNASDYENICEKKDDDPRRNLPPKPLNLVVQNLDETQTTQSSIPHDYENICSVNINREMLGVRHWRTYFDIEDRIHDNSTFKERLQLLDSTLASSLYSEYNSILKGNSRRSISMIDDCESILSRSLPDLSALKLETCFEEPEAETEEIDGLADLMPDNKLMDVLNQLRANRTAMNKSNSVDDIPNYETIWIGDVDQPESEELSSQVNSTVSKSSLVVTIGDVRTKESMCNLYYSTMSDLSSRYYSERLRRNCSRSSTSSHQTSRSSAREMMRAISVPDNKTLLEVSELIEEQRKQEEEQIAKKVADEGIGSATALGNTPVASGDQSRPRRKFSILRERFEYPHWTPLKSPLRRRQTAQRRNSLQDRTAKALQAGIKVFRRPRIHVITPKKEDKDTPRLKSPFKSKTVTPTTPTIRKNVDTPTQSKRNANREKETPISSVHKTPKLRTPADNKLLKGTPKTSTPDDTKQNTLKKARPAVDPVKVKKIIEGPKTSTPEGNKQLPQISILSAVSSVVASPENVQPRMPFSENYHQNRMNVASADNTPSCLLFSENFHPNRVNSQTHLPQIHKDSESMSVKAGTCAVKEKSIKLTLGHRENSCDALYPLQAASNLPKYDQLGFNRLHASSQDVRYAASQPMFSGALGLPQFQPETRQTIISVSETRDTARNQQNISISHIVLSSPQSPEINMQKSTLSPNSKIFSRRI